jgi:hypothetical protein
MDEIKETKKISRWRNFLFFNDAIVVFLSQTLGFLIFAIAGIVYVNQLLRGSSQKLLTVGVTAFAITAGLSGLCYRMASNLSDDKGKSIPLYAGEKFFHSCLLLIQTICLKYIQDNMSSFKIVTWLDNIINFSLSIIISFVGMFATYFFLYGFEALNDFFWKRFMERKHGI